MTGPAVDIREVAMRDGLQIEAPVDLAAKIRLHAAIAATGVRRIELTAFVSPSKVPALADAEDLVRSVAAGDHRDDVEYSALVAGLGGVRRAVAAGITSLEYVVSASDAHSAANVGRSSAESVALIEPIAQIVRSHGGVLEVIVATAWDCPFAGPTPAGRVTEAVAAAAGAGAARITIADTIGTAVPGRVRSLFDAVADHAGDAGLGAHFHDTRGTGLASAFAAVEHGVTRLDASAGGLGGCPFAPGASGNIATEELVYLLHDSGYDTGLDLAATLDAARVAREITGRDAVGGLLGAGDRRRDAG